MKQTKTRKGLFLSILVFSISYNTQIKANEDIDNHVQETNTNDRNKIIVSKQDYLMHCKMNESDCSDEVDSSVCTALYPHPKAGIADRSASSDNQCLALVNICDRVKNDPRKLNKVEEVISIECVKGKIVPN